MLALNGFQGFENFSCLKLWDKRPRGYAEEGWRLRPSMSAGRYRPYPPSTWGQSITAAILLKDQWDPSAAAHKQKKKLFMVSSLLVIHLKFSSSGSTVSAPHPAWKRENSSSQLKTSSHMHPCKLCKHVSIFYPSNEAGTCSRECAIYH